MWENRRRQSALAQVAPTITTTSPTTTFPSGSRTRSQSRLAARTNAHHLNDHGGRHDHAATEHSLSLPPRHPSPVPLPHLRHTSHSTHLALHLPHDTLLNIFSGLFIFGKIEGGDLIDWTSNGHLSPLTLVCQAWKDAATTALFQSVRITGATQARQFLAIIRRQPALANRVTTLVLGLEVDEECSEEDLGQAAGSREIVQVLLECPKVQHLQVRPLHDGIRNVLLKDISKRKLLSLVIAPRLVQPTTDWTRSLWLANDYQLFLPTLRRLELDYWTTIYATSNDSIAPTFSSLPLEEVRLCCEVLDGVLYSVLATAGPTLLVADIYTERLHNIDMLYSSLSTCVAQITALSFISNPTNEELESWENDGITPLFDRLLPHFQSLESLSVAATDISVNVFRLLPPSLQELEIQNLNSFAPFVFEKQLINDLENWGLVINLKTFLVRDEVEVWADEDVSKMKYSCKRRGVDFAFSAEA